MAAEKPKKTRYWVSTNFNCNSIESYEQIMKDRKITFLAFGLETAPTTGKLHHQVWFRTKNAYLPNSGLVLKRLGSWFGTTHSYIHGMDGNFEQNDDYCGKEGTLTKLGKEPKQGERVDLSEMAERMKDGELKVSDILLENQYAYHQYGRTLHALEAELEKSKVRTEMTGIIWIYGDAEVGKTTIITKGCEALGLPPQTAETHFVKCAGEEYWDGYNGHPYVVLNEFRANLMTIRELCALGDHAPMTVKIKCKPPKQMVAKRIIITSIRPWYEEYACALAESGEQIRQLQRRIKLVKVTMNKKRKRHMTIDSAKCSWELEEEKWEPIECSEGGLSSHL